MQNHCSKFMTTTTQDGWMKSSLLTKPWCFCVFVFLSLQEEHIARRGNLPQTVWWTAPPRCHTLGSSTQKALYSRNHMNKERVTLAVETPRRVCALWSEPPGWQDGQARRCNERHQASAQQCSSSQTETCPEVFVWGEHNNVAPPSIPPWLTGCWFHTMSVLRIPFISVSQT